MDTTFYEMIKNQEEYLDASFINEYGIEVPIPRLNQDIATHDYINTVSTDMYEGVFIPEKIVEDGLGQSYKRIVFILSTDDGKVINNIRKNVYELNRDFNNEYLMIAPNLYISCIVADISFYTYEFLYSIKLSDKLEAISSEAELNSIFHISSSYDNKIEEIQRSIMRALPTIDSVSSIHGYR